MTVDYLNALNVGSGLKTNEIIDALVEAEFGGHGRGDE